MRGKPRDSRDVDKNNRRTDNRERQRSGQSNSRQSSRTEVHLCAKKVAGGAVV